jgi:hypothetical protein
MRKRRKPLVASPFFSDFGAGLGDDHNFLAAPMRARYLSIISGLRPRGVACGGPTVHFC